MSIPKKAIFCIPIILLLLVIIIFIIFYSTSEQSADFDYSFPDGFLIGVSSAAYQIEGASDKYGKSENIWDYIIRIHPYLIIDNSTGHIACDSYHKYKEDIKLMNDIGIDHYRFTFSWSRILPTGYSDYVNNEGIRYYHNVLDELEKYGIKPMVTIYHWDHPQSLEELGGWLNESMIKWYTDYSTLVFREFGHRVKFFSTINEPQIYCTLLEGFAIANGGTYNASHKYECVHNMLMAHASVYHTYDKNFRSKQNGQVGMFIHCAHHYSKDKNDLKSSDIAFEFDCGWQANPIFSKDGDYPKIMKEIVANNSKLEGLAQSKLPTFSKGWIEYIKGSSDYFGLNYYFSDLVEPRHNFKTFNYQDVAFNLDDKLLHSIDEKWSTTESDLAIVPEGLGDLLRQIKTKYNNPPVYIGENGFASANILNDTNRSQFIHDHMKEMLIAIKKDDCNVKAYTYWSFLDSMEWVEGYTRKFGLVHVDFNDPERKRTLKESASWFKSVLTTGKLLPV